MLYWIVGLAFAILIAFLLKPYINGGVCKLKTSLDKKVVFITGANTGIGRATAIDLAKRGATCIIACRDQKKGLAVAKEIEHLGCIPPLLLPLDLNDLRSVEQCVKELSKTSFKKIDILINNAGIMATQKRELSKQGIELHFAVNYLGHFHLTNLLLPYLEKAQNARIINVASLAHTYSKMDLNDINADNHAGSFLWSLFYTHISYGNSKLANILHAATLNQELELKGIKAVSLHPGIVKTELIRNMLTKPIFKAIIILGDKIYEYISKTPAQGAQTTIHCALEEFSKLQGGAYYSDCKVKPVAKKYFAFQRQLQQVSEQLIAQTSN